MRKLIVGLAVMSGATAGAVALWRRNPRIGTHFTNEVLNPLLVERGVAGAGRSELGTLEHIGRRTGTRRLTPVHPVPTETGFRIVVPLGEASEWARNVVAAGRCRLQLHDTVYDLDEPVLLAPDELGDLSKPSAWLGTTLGMRYLLLHRFGERPGILEATVGEPAAPAESGEEAPATVPVTA